MISAEHALQILREEGCSPEVIRHIQTVSEKAVEIAKKISQNNNEVNSELVKVGALLHDIGRSKTHGISHGIEGAKILRERGLEEFTGFAENHLGAGIDSKEAKKLELPPKDYLPKSLEEKIVTYADNLVRKDKLISYQEARQELREELGPNLPALSRFAELHKELKQLGGVE